MAVQYQRSKGRKATKLLILLLLADTRTTPPKKNKTDPNEQKHPTKTLTGTFPTLLAEEQLQFYAYSYTSVCSFVLCLVQLQHMAVSRCVGVTRCFYVPEPLLSFIRYYKIVSEQLYNVIGQ